MKTVAGIVLLLLLLCNMLGLSIAVLCLNAQYETAAKDEEKEDLRVLKAYVPSIPYANAWEASNENEGLYRIDDQLYNVVRQVHENDTLYVTLQMNASAWQRFTELSDMMQQVNADQEASNPVSRTMKLLHDLFKIYLPVNGTALECAMRFECRLPKALYADLPCSLISQALQLPSQPPETV
ncbi:MAG: hypothetical protein ABIN80_01160 [Dyadobacter sp.]|uniref:hypothetical protein n=1 Tax=Dyadobacter sp. TaxID=1914288 RepID=UPI0032659CAB